MYFGVSPCLFKGREKHFKAFKPREGKSILCAPVCSLAPHGDNLVGRIVHGLTIKGGVYVYVCVDGLRHISNVAQQ